MANVTSILDARNAAQRAADDLGALLRARVSLIWIVASEERRIERQVIRIAAACQYLPRLWDTFSGLTEADGSPVDSELNDPLAAMAQLRRTSTREAWIMRDLPRSFTPDGSVIRAVRSMARIASEAPRPEARAIVVLSPSRDVPPELASVAAVIDWPSPDRAEIASILDSVIGAQRQEVQDGALKAGDRDRAIDAAIGLSGEAVETAYSHALVTSRRIVPQAIAAEKKRLIKGKGLEWYDPIGGGLDAIGGLDLLKSWAMSRAAALTPAARAYGLPLPKGVLLVGPPGTGKSLAAKALSTSWGVPLIKADLGAAKSKWVGESEANIRNLIRTVETIAPCVLWVDEIEKALSGATSGSADGGVSSDALGVLLTWMQETQSGVFVVATCNDVRSLPPELLRKGRFDDLFFIDLPNRRERAAIVHAALRQYGRTPDGIEADQVSAVTEGYTGAEIAALVPEGLYAAFSDGARPLVTGDLIQAARATTPLSRTAGDKIKALRDWAKGRTRSASTPDVSEATSGRSLDVEGV